MLPRPDNPRSIDTTANVPSVKTRRQWFARWWPRKAHRRDRTSSPAEPCDSLTPEEIRQLTRLRERIRAKPPALALDLEDPAPEFARWLVEHGKLSEGLPPGARD